MPHSVQPDQELLSQAQIPAVQGERGRSSVTSRYSHGCEHGISVTAVTGTLLQAVHKAVSTCEKQLQVRAKGTAWLTLAPRDCSRTMAPWALPRERQKKAPSCPGAVWQWRIWFSSQGVQLH